MADELEFYKSKFDGTTIDKRLGMIGNSYSELLKNLGLQYITNPNLLDNWFFGRPVNQRNGYIIPAGVEYYKVDGFVPQGPIPETVRVDYIDYAGSAIFNYGGVPCYVPKGGGYVRGYAGSGYTVDRWKALSLQGAVTCENDCLAIENTNGTVASIIIDQIFEPDLSNALKGKTLTLSVMVKSVKGKFAFQSGNKTFVITKPGLSYFVIPDWVDKYNYGMRCFNPEGAGKIEIAAAKLELGDTQTLAHKENGVWVLNEIPDFGEQLRRCQRYYQVLPAIYWLPENADGTNRLTIPILDMRTIPTVTYEPADGNTGTLQYDAKLAQKNSIQFYAIGVTGICGVKNIRLSADL